MPASFSFFRHPIQLGDIMYLNSVIETRIKLFKLQIGRRVRTFASQIYIDITDAGGGGCCEEEEDVKPVKLMPFLLTAN